MKRQLPRYNVVSETADGFGFAARLAAEGEAVRFWARSGAVKSVGDGFPGVEKVGDLEDMLHDASPDSDVFIFDVSGNGLIADFFQDRGFAVLGGSVLADRLERDRVFGYKVMADCGIMVPETRSFVDFATAIEFVENHAETRWVYKPSKQLGDLSASHVSYDAEDLVEMLYNIEAEVEMEKPQFELQAFEPGVALSTELWFQHGEFIPELTNHTLERKELMNDDLGPSGGCLGNVVWMCPDPHCAVCEAASGLVLWAAREHYHGMLDLNVIVAEADGGIYGLEFTPRFGYDASPTLLWELVKPSLGEFLADAARSQLRSVDTREGFAGAVRVTLPPWPTEKHNAEENVPIRGLDDVKDNEVFWYNVKRDDAGKLCSAGAWGIVCLFTGHSVDPANACKRSLVNCQSLRLKNKQYRTDLGKQFVGDLTKLESLVGKSMSTGVAGSR